MALEKKSFFISDFHLGTDGHLSSREREKKIVRWLDQQAPQMDHLYLLGDVFDYWFEYKRVVPKGFTRLLGKLAELRDYGVEMSYFTGNHDMWMFTYMEEEFGIPIFRKPIEKIINEKHFLIGHGDGLGPGDYGYKFIKQIFANRFCQWLFARIHPNTAIGLMKHFSRQSRMMTAEEPWLENKEWLLKYCEESILSTPYDFMVFGHRHLPVYWRLSNGKTMYINLGDWIYHYSYGIFDGKEFSLRFFESDHKHLITNV
jgi:UDP-2,3-diacylglucosamine hydrolase